VVVSLHLVPVTLKQANEHVQHWHRHSKPVRGHLFCVGAATENGTLVAVGLAGRPVARNLDDGQTVEVTRIATDGTRNANSLLYGALTRAAFALGYRRVVTYTLATESGSSLRAAGWKVIASMPARPGWDTVSRPRHNSQYLSAPRQLWESTP